jgi:hypothetical protein
VFVGTTTGAVVEVGGGVTLGVTVACGAGICVGGIVVAVCADCAVVINSNRAVMVRSGVEGAPVGATLAGRLQAVAINMIARRTIAFFRI